MKQMIQRMREEKGGFTLAELLIVVAIVGVLVAIAIPVFTAQLDKANAATDEANARSGYASAQATANVDSLKTGTLTLMTDGTAEDAAKSSKTPYVTKGDSSKLGTAVDISGQSPSWTPGSTITYVIGSDGNTTITPVAGSK